MFLGLSLLQPYFNGVVCVHRVFPQPAKKQGERLAAALNPDYSIGERVKQRRQAVSPAWCQKSILPIAQKLYRFQLEASAEKASSGQLI